MIDKIEAKAVARAIRNYRIDHDYSSQEIAEFLEVTPSTYSKYENCVLVISGFALVNLSLFYGVSVEELLRYARKLFFYILEFAISSISV